MLSILCNHVLVANDMKLHVMRGMEAKYLRFILRKHFGMNRVLAGSSIFGSFSRLRTFVPLFTLNTALFNKIIKYSKG